MRQPLEHNGKQFTNADSWRSAKAMSPAKPMAAPGEAEEQDGSAVAQEHGPANHVDIEHEEEMGVHHVHSTHPDGHEHHSDHGSKEEAHEHGKKLAGVGAEEPGDSMGEEDAEPWGKEE